MSAKTLNIAPGISLPLETVTQSVAILAKKRVGKSYTMRRFVEQLLEAKQQVVLVDPKGDQWGIRSSADGKKPGFPVLILGGEHGDLPLEKNAGEVVAKLVVEEQVNILLDVSHFSKTDLAYFMAIFLENLYRLKAQEKYRTAMMLVVDEADAIAPQKPQANEARMLGAIDDIVRRGGQRGIGTLLITQRSAVLNKNVLTQSQMLIVLRLIAPQDMAAMKAWIDVHGTTEEAREMMSSLPALPIGDAYFWSPGWPTDAGIFKRAHILPITTFDSAATPRPGQRKVVPKNLADVNLTALKGQMAETVEKLKRDDPKSLKAEIVRLQTELKKPQPAAAASPMGVSQWLEYGRKLGYADFFENKFRAEEQKKYDVEVRRLKGIIGKMDDLFTAGRKLAGSEAMRVVQVPTPRNLPPPTGKSVVQPVIQQPAVRNTPEYATEPGAKKWGPGERAVLGAVAQHADGITREHLTVLTGYKRASRNTYLQRLSQAGLIEAQGEKFVVTDPGMAELGSDFQPIPSSGPELVEHVMRTLPVGEAKILKALLESPQGLERDTITELTEYTRASRNTYIQRLGARQLVVVEGAVVKPAAILI